MDFPPAFPFALLRWNLAGVDLAAAKDPTSSDVSVKDIISIYFI
jgi:hypothetical protein